ncbi:Phospholipase B-like protein C [Tritrichomonas foetus]|uniref:Phospholipase B-like n=1 Tax=Tritrichomonas foetus TaxID=1144522 RepID=A0A1J4KXX7_9EUKA|nr:Phospholipase B-like protein C [Tritrichomonas foetus]|eukprot:OHT16034.1 Phospholipase B-like protein C [Tritrichomonas foetus]
MIFALFFLSYSSTETIATGYYNKETKTVDVILGQQLPNGTCTAMYNNSIFNDGWYKLDLNGAEGADPIEMAYCIGYLEGFLAQSQIFDAFNLYLDSIFGNRSNPYPQNFIDYMTENMNYALEHFSQDPNYNIFLQMFNGLSDGYNTKAFEKCRDSSQCNQNITKVLLWSYSSNGDLIDILPMLGLMKYSDHKRARCTAFIKLLPDFSDIYMSHNTWTDYRQLHAVMKKIHLPIDYFNAKTVILSTRIGMVGSVDDFYVSDSNLMVFETSLLNMNETLLKSYVHPKRLNYWVRANTAMFVAQNGTHWIDIFMKDNSGTYNNDYYIIDVNKFTPGEKPTKDLVWLVEQTPSDIIYKSDVTQNLTTKGHIASFNVPVSSEIYDLMDYKSRADIDVLYVPFFENCRYLISEREMPKVENFEDFKQIGRFNQYLTDPVSNGNPLATIAARNELNTSLENDDFFEGALDNKVCRASDVFTKFMVHVINSPTNSVKDNVPVFTFNFDRLKNYPHDGLPETFDFQYIKFNDGDADICMNLTKNQCSYTKFCGWCHSNEKCMAGTIFDGPLYDKCDDFEIPIREGYIWVITGGAFAAVVLLITIIFASVIYVNGKKAKQESYKPIE